MEYPNRGTLWTNSYKRGDTQPDMKGDLKIELDLFRQMLDTAESDHVVIKLSAWLGKHTDGNRKISILIDTSQKAATEVKDPWDD